MNCKKSPFFITILLVLILSSKGYPQLFKNPSFEGTPMRDKPPLPWEPCKSNSTPDTQPGSWEVSNVASNGKTYLSLVARGDLGPNANTTEDVQILLNAKFKTDKTYNFSIDLAISKTFVNYNGFDELFYDTPCVLKVWGGINSCERSELLWQSQAIDNINWQTYDFAFSPQTQEIKYIILEPDYKALPTYFGNILIDNIVDKDAPQIPGSEPSRCNIETYNIFTPNGDGYNDIFIFNPISNVVKFNLKVFNRWGKMVFESNDLKKGWDGYNCSEGIYFWLTEYYCIDDNKIFTNNQKGSVRLLRSSTEEYYSIIK